MSRVVLTDDQTAMLKEYDEDFNWMADGAWAQAMQDVIRHNDMFKGSNPYDVFIAYVKKMGAKA